MRLLSHRNNRSSHSYSSDKFRILPLSNFFDILLITQVTMCVVVGVVVRAQSTCDFLRDIPYLNMGAVGAQSQFPTNPITASKRASAVGDDDVNSNAATSASTTGDYYCSRDGERTCCNASVVVQMERFARTKFNETVKHQINLLSEFFDAQSAIFYKHLNASLKLTERQLTALFEKTYGPYYVSHATVFTNFFAKIGQFFSLLEASTNASADAKQLLDDFFGEVYIAEYAVLNPTVVLNEKERACVASLRAELRPFGALTEKISLLLTRSLNTWRTLLSALEDASAQIKSIQKNTILSTGCVRAIVQLRHCHLCAPKTRAADARLRPCLGYCVNVLRGCLYALADVEPQFVAFIDAQLRLSARLKGVHNPYSMLAPIPVQISEAIMYFQENSAHISRKIYFRCFQPQFRFRVRRKTAENEKHERVKIVNICNSTNENNNKSVNKNNSAVDERRKETWSLAEEEEYASPEMRNEAADVDTNVHANQEDEIRGNANSLDAKWFQLYIQSGRMAEAVRDNLADYVDKLRRMRKFWSSIPSTLCEDGEIAAARPRHRRARDGSFFAETENCWNGTSVAGYRRPVAGSGARKQKFNPEFGEVEMRLNFSTEAFVEERLQFLRLAAKLNACYEDRSVLPEELANTSIEFRPISEDDEDAEASGWAEVEDEFDEMLPKNEQKFYIAPAGGGKRYATIRHPTNNSSATITRNFPAISSASTAPKDYSASEAASGTKLLTILLIFLYPLLRIHMI